MRVFENRVLRSGVAYFNEQFRAVSKLTVEHQESCRSDCLGD